MNPLGLRVKDHEIKEQAVFGGNERDAFLDCLVTIGKEDSDDF